MIRTLILLILISACSSTTRPVHSVVHCESPRPQLCTMDYQPVCATRDNGVRCVTTPCDSTERSSYANACGACADEKVISYHEGSCDI